MLSIADSEQPKSDIVLLYPGESLKRQVAGWADTHPEYSLEVSFATFPAEIQEVLRNAAVALLDATEDPRQAAVAFSQAVAQLGGYSVAIYTEKMYEWLELFVRIRGALLLLGPIGRHQWEEFFKGILREASRRRAAQQRSGALAGEPASSGKAALRGHSSGNGTSAGRRRRKTGVKPR